MKPTRAMILAAGLGTRMRPLTLDIPKPLIPLKGKALIDWCLDWLEAAGIDQVVINTSYLAEKLEMHLSTRPHPRISLSREEPEPLETGGGVAKALPMLGDAPFITLNSDAVFAATPTHPITHLAQGWSDDLDFLMLLVPRARAIGFEGAGDFVLGEGGRIRRPRAGEEAPYIFTGVEMIHPRAFIGCPAGKFSLSKLWSQNVDDEGYFTRVRAIIHEGDWLNVGDLTGLAAAEAYSGTFSFDSRM